MKGLITSQYSGVECQFNNDGWFNATLAASRFNKSVHEWIRLPDTQKYIEALQRKYGKIPYLKTKRGNNGGTWLHPKLAVRFAQWLDIDFAIWCDEQIDQLLRGSHPVIDVKKARHAIASSFKVTMEILKLSREQQGKESTKFHYMNEAKLINWAFKGEFKGLDRDSLTFEEMDLINELSLQDAVLIGAGIGYDQRKTALNLFAQNFKAKQLSHQSNVLEA